MAAHKTESYTEAIARLMLHHRLDAVFSMPDDLFYPRV